MRQYLTPTIAIFMLTCLISCGFAQQISISKSSNKTRESEATGNISIHLKIYKSGDLKENIAFQTVNGKTKFSVESIPQEDGKIQPRTFSGTLSRIDKQTYLLNYTLSQTIAITTNDGDRKTMQYRDTGWQTELEITKGEEVVLMKEADTLYTLLIGGILNKSK